MDYRSRAIRIQYLRNTTTSNKYEEPRYAFVPDETYHHVIQMKIKGFDV